MDFKHTIYQQNNSDSMYILMPVTDHWTRRVPHFGRQSGRIQSTLIVDISIGTLIPSVCTTYLVLHTAQGSLWYAMPRTIRPIHLCWSLLYFVPTFHLFVLSAVQSFLLFVRFLFPPSLLLLLRRMNTPNNCFITHSLRWYPHTKFYFKYENHLLSFLQTDVRIWGLKQEKYPQYNIGRYVIHFYCF